MSAVHCVVVWEWAQDAGGGAPLWLPHAPAVARTLERAYAKKLTRVVLADADPTLRGHYVNLRTLTQYADTPDGGCEECPVRRACYSVQSACGRGVRWDWASLQPRRELHYEPLPVEVQTLLEEAWQRGVETISWRGWALSAGRLRARRAPAPGPVPGETRALRRAPQPPYPLARPPQHEPPPAPPTPPARTPIEGRRPRIPQQHTGSSVHSVQSIQSVQSMQSMQSVQSAQSAPARAGARSASPRDRKPGLARQILHNLNIFSSSNSKWSEKCPRDSRELSLERPAAELGAGPARDCESASTTDAGSARRHSVDTVSTYLSHESKDSLQQASVGSLLNCSAGSDEVFESCPPSQPLSRAGDDDSDLIVGADEEAWRVCAWVRGVSVVQWGALCPACLQPLDAGRAPVLALAPCQHLLHLHCLNDQLAALRRDNQPLHIECRVCGGVYGREAGPVADQPAGSMAWRLQPTPLPQTDCPHILVTYNFQSGRQGPQHPVPGAPYYAVGFPRYTLLPDNPLGRQVLSALRAAWSAARLFGVCVSQTTGREHVVAWRCAPPPHRADHYRPPACPARLLRASLARLHALLRGEGAD